MRCKIFIFSLLQNWYFSAKMQITKIFHYNLSPKNSQKHLLQNKQIFLQYKNRLFTYFSTQNHLFQPTPLAKQFILVSRNHDAKFLGGSHYVC